MNYYVCSEVIYDTVTQENIIVDITQLLKIFTIVLFLQEIWMIRMSRFLST